MPGGGDCAGSLACPVCGLALAEAGGSLACAAGHSFDRARSGYVNLLGGRPSRRVGDSAEMVAARAEFLAGGRLAPLSEALATTACERGEGARLVVELGSGIGNHLEAVRARLAERGPGAPCAIGLDLSKAAAARAARAHPACLFAVADVEASVPVHAASVDLALSVFAPRPAAELARIVRPGGLLLVAAAGDRHLAELRRRFDLLDVRPGKADELRRRLHPAFEQESLELLEFPLDLSADACRAAVMMGPSARHRDGPPAVPPGGVTDAASILLASFRRTASAPA